MVALRALALLLWCAALLAGCSQPQPPPDAQAAQEALFAFFEQLNAGDYARAAALYGGGYEIMIEHNPELDAQDHAALFQNACTINGAACLKVKSATLQPEGDGQALVFLVEFANSDGSLFIQGPCCGGDATDSPPQSQFRFRVAADGKGGYVVLDAPVYLP